MDPKNKYEYVRTEFMFDENSAQLKEILQAIEQSATNDMKLKTLCLFANDIERLVKSKIRDEVTQLANNIAYM